MKIFHANSLAEWRKWLEENAEKESRVFLTKYKKHTKRPTFSHQEAMHEAICFGWIDTTAKRVDEDVWGVNFVKRGENARWSKNTLKYARQMIRKGKMTPAGLKAYKHGLKKPPIDLDLPDNHMPEDLIKSMKTNKVASANFEKLAPSYKKTYVRWIERAKMPETRARRIAKVVEWMIIGRTKWGAGN